MTSRQFPQIQTVKELSSLSFWRFVRMKECRLKGAYPGAVISPIKIEPAGSKPQMLGRIYHTAMELLNRLQKSGMLTEANVGEGFLKIVAQEELSALKSQSSRHLANISDWEQTGLMYDAVLDLALRIKGLRASEPANASVHTENKLVSNDGTLFGYPDVYYLNDSGIDLVDYKTGRIEEDGEIRDIYTDQLYFYAALIEENYGKYPRTLTLAGAGGKVPIRPDPNRSRTLVSEMKATLRHFNQQVQISSDAKFFGSPSSESCSRCNAKLLCPAFWDKSKDIQIDNGFHSLRGFQVGDVRRSGQGGSSLDIQVETATFETNAVVVNRIFEAKFPNFRSIPGQPLGLVGLKLVSTVNAPTAELSKEGLLVSFGDLIEAT